MLAKTFQKRNNAQSGSNIYIKCTCEKIFLTCTFIQQITKKKLGKKYILIKFFSLVLFPKELGSKHLYTKSKKQYNHKREELHNKKHTK